MNQSLHACLISGVIIIAIPILIITTYWLLPYLQETPMNYQDVILDETLIYKAKGSSTWQQNPIMNFPQKISKN